MVPEKAVKLILPDDESLVTHFDRRGMVYVLDAWVDSEHVVAKSDKHSSQGFHRQVRR